MTAIPFYLPESPLHESSPSLPPAHNCVGIKVRPVTRYNSLQRSKLNPSTSTFSLISLFDAENKTNKCVRMNVL